VTLNLVAELFEHVDFGKVSVSELHSLEHVHHPACALTAWCALPATLVLVEFCKAEDSIDHISLVVHHDDGSCAET